MNYLNKVANGNAGEYYFAYWISRYFQWPCRLLDIDVGIDAQVEIFDSEQRSVGDFIAVQIKTTVDENPNVSVSLNNLEYWKSIDDVIIIVSISLSQDEPKMYWKEINDESIEHLISEARKNKSETITVSFNVGNELTSLNKADFEVLPYRGLVEHGAHLIDEIIELCNEYNDLFWSEKDEDYDPLNLTIWDLSEPVDGFNKICDLNERLEKIFFKSPKIMGKLAGIDRKSESMKLAKTNLRNYIEFQLNSDFSAEFSSQWRSHEYHSEIVEIVDEYSY